jgi:hypothetical protein
MNITDDIRMSFIMQDVVDYNKVANDRHQYARGVCQEDGHIYVTEADELEGFRRMVDAAMVAHGFINK